jgi:hypothetical protein
VRTPAAHQGVCYIFQLRYVDQSVIRFMIIGSVSTKHTGHFIPPSQILIFCVRPGMGHVHWADLAHNPVPGIPSFQVSNLGNVYINFANPVPIPFMGFLFHTSINFSNDILIQIVIPNATFHYYSPRAPNGPPHVFDQIRLIT